MSRLLALVAALLCVASPAAAWRYGTPAGGSSSPSVIPGGVQPAYDNTNSTAGKVVLTNVTLNTIATTYHGTNTDNGYSVRGSMRWDALPFSLISGTQQVGLFAWHMPTNAEKNAGISNDVTYVNVRCDGGSWFTITGPSANANAGGVVDWNFTVNDANFADGLHQCDAVAVPATGPDIVAQGPPFDQYGDGYELISASNIIIDSTTRGVAGNILTVLSAGIFENWEAAAASGVISIGQSVATAGVAPGTFIDGDSTHNASSCVAQSGSNCTGAGGVGTYHVNQSQALYGAVLTGKIDNGSGSAGTLMTITGRTSGGVVLNLTYGSQIVGSGVSAGTVLNGANNQGSCTPGPTCTGNGMTGTYSVNTSQLVASTTLYAGASAVFGSQRSFYFITNHGGSISRPTVYVCDTTCNGATGNDSTGTGSAAAPYATVGKAFSQITAQDSATTYHHGKWGGTVCLMAGHTYTYSGSVTVPDAALGYVTLASANADTCAAPSDPGGATITNTPQATTRAFFAHNTRWRSLNFIGYASNLDPTYQQKFVVDHVTQVHDTLGNGGLLGAGAWMCLESTSWFGSDGGCSGAYYIRGSTFKYAYNDGMHEVSSAVSNTVDGVGNALEWASATFNTATPTVLTISLPSELSGYNLSAIFPTNQPLSAVNASNQPCYSNDANPTINDGAKTLTLTGVTTTGNCTNGSTVYVNFDNSAHPDNFQQSSLNIVDDVLIQGNSFNAGYKSFTQGEFIQPAYISGFYVNGNSFNNDVHDVESLVLTTGGVDAWISGLNQYAGTNSYRQDLLIGSTNETFVKDQCLNGGTIIPPQQTGVNIRALQATSSACYSTTSP